MTRRVWDALVARPVLWVFILALSVRVLVAVFVSAFFSGSLILDDGTYEAMALDKARGATEAWDPFTHQLYKGTATLLVPLTYLYKLLGESPLVGRLFLCTVGASSAALVTLLALRVTSRERALLAGVIFALLPSLVLWSSVVLKDAVVWLLLLPMALLIGSKAARDVTVIGGLIVCLVLLGHLRVPSLVIASWAVGLSVWMGRRTMLVRGASIAMTLFIPLLMGFGPAGWTVISGAQSLDEGRARLAEGAESAIVTPISERTTVSNEEGAGQGTESPIERQDEPSTDGELSVNIRHLPRGLFTILFEPVPWRDTDSRSMRLAKLEGLLWYPLLVIAGLGIPRALRRLDVMAFPLLTLGATVLVYALAEGSIGGAYRHRSEFVWTVCILASLGLRPRRDPKT